MQSSAIGNRLNGNVVIWHYVSDLPRAVEWYSTMLGLKPTDSIDVASFFPINENTKLALSNRFKSNVENELPSCVNLDLQTDNIFEVHSNLKSKGVKVEEIQNPIFNYHEFYFQDLDNNQIRVHSFVE